MYCLDLVDSMQWYWVGELTEGMEFVICRGL